MKILLYILFFYSLTFGQVANLLLGNIKEDAGEETGEVFADGFEDNTFDAWSNKVEEGDNVITIETDTVHSGTYAAKFDYAGVDDENYITLNAPDLESTYFRGYFHFGNATGGAQYNSFCFLTFWDASAQVATLYLRTDGEDYFNQWHLTTIGDDMYATTDDHMVYNDSVRIEIGYERGNGVDDGWCTVRIDGDSVCGVVGQAYTNFVDSIKVGSSINASAVHNADSYYYADDIVVDSSDWVGVKP